MDLITKNDFLQKTNSEKAKIIQDIILGNVKMED